VGVLEKSVCVRESGSKRARENNNDNNNNNNNERLRRLSFSPTFGDNADDLMLPTPISEALRLVRQSEWGTLRERGRRFLSFENIMNASLTDAEVGTLSERGTLMRVNDSEKERLSEAL
jgi:hypothetical protein